MKKLFILLTVFLSAFSFAKAQYVVHTAVVPLHDEMLNLMISGDEGNLTEIITNGNDFIGCTIEGNSITIVSEDSTKKGILKIKIKAIAAGQSQINLKFTNYKVRYKVNVFELSQIKVVKAADISKTPDTYFNQFVILNGVSLDKAKKRNQLPDVSGKILKKSDWIFQDESGLLYVTGLTGSSSQQKFSVLCTVEDIPRMGWIVRGNRILTLPEKK
ncbi:MAG: hypothetical protein V2A54_17130 [Bacteroidota bacterium]